MPRPVRWKIIRPRTVFTGTIITMPSKRSPSKLRKSQSRHGRRRRLWLRVIVQAPSGTSRRRVTDVLVSSIMGGTYSLPPKWSAQIEWRNKADDPMKSDEWQNALTDSADSSPGFDQAVIGYLRRSV